MKPDMIEMAQDFPNGPLLRVLCYLETQEHTLEFGQVEFSQRWYTPARKIVERIWAKEVTTR